MDVIGFCSLTERKTSPDRTLLSLGGIVALGPRRDDGGNN